MSKTIVPINKETVHKICSGQVVLNLAIALKELVENSLDAKATAIDVRLREFGSELIEVVDNGIGVHPDNFQALALKHYTSKLRNFSDLVDVETFGFRGEALSSLCAVGELVIVTRHESEPCGSKLVFDHLGILRECQPCPRQIGTSVTLTNLFSSLPVRQKEFHRNLKREFIRASQLLSSYCLISTNVKITCVNQTKKGGRMTFLSTQNNTNIRQNISCVFGSKQLANLLEVVHTKPNQDILDEFNISDQHVDIFKLEGYISSCEHGSGRSSSDRQFFFINSRPCDINKIVKLINEIYHRFNSHQYPFILLNILIPKQSVDVNVTPDKRLIFFEHEKALLAILKSSLMKTFENIPSTYRMNTSICNTFPESLKADKTVISDRLASFSIEAFSRKLNDRKRTVEGSSCGSTLKQIKLQEIFKLHEKTDKITELNQIESFKSEDDELISNRPIDSVTRDSSYILKTRCESNYQNYSIHYERSPLRECTVEVFPPPEKPGTSNSQNYKSHYERSPTIECPVKISPSLKIPDTETSSINNEDSLERECPITFSEPFSPYEQNSRLLGQSVKNSGDIEFRGDSEDCQNESVTSPSPENSAIVYNESLTSEMWDAKKKITLDISLDRIAASFRARKRNKRSGMVANRFHAEIAPEKNELAEEELKKEISKDIFRKMKIVGQFNLGFIVTKLENDLFIIDQHATDEKFNFETLQRTTTLTSQKLVIPQELNLTATNECVLRDNIEVLRKNGFEFSVDDSAEVTKKVKLTSIPVSYNWQFGRDDVDEMLFMLQDAPHTLCRPTRIRSMFASRACRKSVMIGTALNVADMRRLINNMGCIEQPWNCPHGRPTMRHLINISLLK